MYYQPSLDSYRSGIICAIEGLTVLRNNEGERAIWQLHTKITIKF